MERTARMDDVAGPMTLADRDALDETGIESRASAECAMVSMKPRDTAEMPFVSVIVPARNESRHIERALDAILSGDYPTDRMEVIVADGMSTDGTRELVARYASRDRRVRMIDNPQRITPAALNRAIEAARGEIIARIDAHAAVAPDYLSRCVDHLECFGAANVGGYMRTLPQSDGPFSRVIVAALSLRFGVGNSYFRIGKTGGNEEPRWVDTVFGGCWPREVFDRVGLFNERLERSQDMEFNLRVRAAGGKTLLAPDVRSDYYARSDLRSFWRHNLLNGEWAVLPFLYSEIIPVSLRHLVPLIFVIALSLGIAALSWSPWPLAAVGIPYTILNLAASAQASWRERKLALAALMPVVFASLHVGYGIGSLCGLARMLISTPRARMEETQCVPQD